MFVGMKAPELRNGESYTIQSLNLLVFSTISFVTSSLHLVQPLIKICLGDSVAFPHLSRQALSSIWFLFMSISAVALFIRRPEGLSVPLLEIQNTFKEEYENLDDDEREAMVQEFKESKQPKAARNISRPSPRARIQEVSNTVRNIKLLGC